VHTTLLLPLLLLLHVLRSAQVLASIAVQFVVHLSALLALARLWCVLYLYRDIAARAARCRVGPCTPCHCARTLCVPACVRTCSSAIVLLPHSARSHFASSSFAAAAAEALSRCPCLCDACTPRLARA
jgi:hypothetical protein